MNLCQMINPRDLLDDLMISKDPHDSSRGVLTTIFHGKGYHPGRWMASDYWKWLPKDNLSLVRVSVAYNQSHISFQVSSDSKGHFYLNKYPAENPIHKLSLQRSIEIFDDLYELSTHISSEMYAKISKKGMAAIMVALKQKDPSLDKVLLKLQKTLRKAVQSEHGEFG